MIHHSKKRGPKASKYKIRFWETLPKSTQKPIGNILEKYQKFVYSARFMSKVIIAENGCWQWQASKSRGYAQTSFGKGIMRTVHRVVYIVLKGLPPEGMTLDHLCRNRSCVNPDHLEVVTSGENVLRGISVVAQNARKTHCKWGHSLGGGNLYTWGGDGARQCRQCRIRRSAEWRQQNA